MENILYIIVLLPIISGIMIYIMPSKSKVLFGIIVQVMQLALSLLSFFKYKQNHMLLALGKWQAPVGIMINADSISTSLVLLVSLMFLSFLIYNMHRHYVDKMFLMLFMILQGLLSGIFLMDDLFSIFVLAEVSTMVVSLLIMFKRDNRSMYDGLIYLLVNIFSMTFFLFGLAMIYKQLGSFSMTYIKSIILETNYSKSLFLPYSFIMTSVCLKAALMPLFSWLPKAHGTPSAPSVVSAVLSGIYVKGGIYLYIRLSNVFSTIDTSMFFLICGIITAITGFILAIAQKDIKLILAYHTVSQLGFIMLAINMGNEYAVWGGIYHIISHSIFKSVLFLCAGVIVEEYETRNVYEIKGVFKRMPIVSIACILAILGITGAPLFNGSISKYLIFHGAENSFMEWLLIIINLGTLLSFVKFFTIFTSKDKNNVAKAIVPLNRQLVLIVLGLLCLIGGIFGTKAIEFIYGIKLHIEYDEYLIKAIIYLITLIVAFVLYKIGFTRIKFFVKIRDFDIGFNTIVMSIPLFFFVLLCYLYIT